MCSLSVCDDVVPYTSTISGRIDRKIEFPLPDEKTKRRIFQIHTFGTQIPQKEQRAIVWKSFLWDGRACRGKMTLADDVNLEEFVVAKEPTMPTAQQPEKHCLDIERTSNQLWFQDDLSGADIKVWY